MLRGLWKLVRLSRVLLIDAILESRMDDWLNIPGPPPPPLSYSYWKRYSTSFSISSNILFSIVLLSLPCACTPFMGDTAPPFLPGAAKLIAVSFIMNCCCLTPEGVLASDLG